MNKFCVVLLMLGTLRAWSAPLDDIASPNQAIRDSGAASLRQSYVPPAKNKWGFLLTEIQPGMSEASIEKVLTGYHIKGDGWMNRGGVGPVWYRLNEYWRLACVMDFTKDRLLEVSIEKNVRIFEVEPPPDFTGVWITYYANGQIWTKAGYENGMNFGDYLCYFSDGTKQEVRRYNLQGAQGVSTNYYPSGKVASRVYFKNSKQVGTSTWYNENGSIASTEDHSK